ncbi:hypothetical protein [Devosia sp.]|uniref:hypothetical protein n=1 Tax=Devosia sp. TaxID=1871048 RepID=UPI00292F54F7|nr:hypothetical protein [Devosia sp.]
MSKRFEAKVALVTGGASGLGEAVAGNSAGREPRSSWLTRTHLFAQPGRHRPRLAGEHDLAYCNANAAAKGSIAPQLLIEDEKEQGITVNYDKLAKSWADANAAAN